MAALDLTSALKGTVSQNCKTAEVLEIFSKLFMKIAAVKSAMAKAKEQQNNLQTHPNAQWAVPLPRVVDRPPIPASQLPRVPITIAEADCCIRDGGKRVQMVGMASQVAAIPTQSVEAQPQAKTWEGDPAIGNTRATNRKTKLHFTGQWQWWTKSQVQHKIMDNQYHARGNACMHWRHQANVWDFSGQTDPQKIPMMWFCKWPILFLASKAKYWNIATWFPIPRHRPHGPTLTASSLDGLCKECPAKWWEQTQSSLFPRSRYQEQGQRTSRTASSPASSGLRKPKSLKEQD